MIFDDLGNHYHIKERLLRDFRFRLKLFQLQNSASIERPNITYL